MANVTAAGYRQPIIQYWHAADVPEHLADDLASFRDRNPELQHRVFSEPAAAAFIEERFSAREAAAFGACAVPAMQSDYFRYCAVLALGGVYCDVDFRCRASLRPLLEEERGQLFRNGTGMALNGVFAFREPGHPLLRLCLEIATANIEAREIEEVWGVTGPSIFTGLIMLRRLDSIDAFLEVCDDRAGHWRPRLMSEVVGDFERVVEAFDGVRVNPPRALQGYLANRDAANVEKKHWIDAESIYR
jgi:hypothetical protein